MLSVKPRLQENLDCVRQRIVQAALRSGRSANDVTLVAVTKYVTTEVARALVELGCHDLGESRPQELWRKAEAIADFAPRWHMIGHLQRNKARRTLPLVHLLHSVDSLELLAEMNRLSSECPTSILVEINTSGDATKHGLAPSAASAFVESALEYANVRIRGLMTMAAREGDLDCARENFAALRELRDGLRNQFGERVDLSELSMGMTGDFEVAIEEGATLVRVGSALFEGLET